MRTNRRIFSLLFVLSLAAGGLAAVRNPVAFQKSNIVKQAKGSIPPIDGVRSFDVVQIVGSIPFKRHSHVDMVWEVDPDRRYERTIVDGQGNCSNLVLGLSRYLQLSNIDFQIIHMMRPQDFLKGGGHTLVRTRYVYEGVEHLGLIDVLAGGIPISRNRFLDVKDLYHAIPEFRMLTWNGRPQISDAYFHELPGAGVVGWIPGREVEAYFDFIQSVFLPLGSSRLEKLIFDAVALLLGYYPSIYVEDIGPLRNAAGLRWQFFRASLWLFRSAFFLLPILAWRKRPMLGVLPPPPHGL